MHFKNVEIACLQPDIIFSFNQEFLFQEFSAIANSVEAELNSHKLLSVVTVLVYLLDSCSQMALLH